MLIGVSLVLATSTIHRISTTRRTPPLRMSSSIQATADQPEGGNIIICAGLSCLDLQLVGCTQSSTGSGHETIERFDEAIHCAGGSASMSGTTLALLLRPSSSSSSEEQPTTTTTKTKVHILTKIGPDFAGSTLLDYYKQSGASTDLVLTDSKSRTSMAVLPIYKNGQRGCFVNLACNDGFTPEELVPQLDLLSSTMVEEKSSSVVVDDTNTSENNDKTFAFLFGYPHLLPKMQGKALQTMLAKVRQRLSYSTNNNDGLPILVGVDINGIDGTNNPSEARDVLTPALCEIDVLHLNEDEAIVLFSGSNEETNDDLPRNINDDEVSPELWAVLSWLHEQGCAVVLLSLGSKGAVVSVTPNSERLQQLSSTTTKAAKISSSTSTSSSYNPSMCISQWIPGSYARIPAYEIDGEVNANGAGDALFAGFCLAASSRGGSIGQKIGSSGSSSSTSISNECVVVTPQVAGTFASLVAWQRCDTRKRDGMGMMNASELMNIVCNGHLPKAIQN